MGAQAYLPPPPPVGGQQFLPPPEAYASAYGDRDDRRSEGRYDDRKSDARFDNSYDSYSSEEERPQRARKSKSTSDMKRDDDDDGDEDDEKGKKRSKQTDIAVTIAGALAGGLLGYEVSNRRGKPESFHSLAGAIVGAVGAHEANKFYEGRKGEIREKIRSETDKFRGKPKRRDSRGEKDRYRN